MRRKSEFANGQPSLPTDAAPEPKPTPEPSNRYTGKCCPVCKLAQYTIPDGITCCNGHCYASQIECDAGDPPKSMNDHMELMRMGKAATGAPQAAPESIGQPSSAVGSRKGNGASVDAATLAEAAAMQVAAASDGPRKIDLPSCDSGDEPVLELGSRREAYAKQLDDLVLEPGYERIIERVFSVDPWASYGVLEAGLKLPAPAHGAGYAAVVDALDACEDNARESHRLYVSAKVAVDRFQADASVLSGDMRAQAIAALELEKERGERKKQITDADVESRIAALFPDEWRRVEERRSKARRAVEHLERLADCWKSRGSALKVILETMRR